jgi:carbonic anhydrase
LFSEIFKHIEAASVPGTEGPTGPLDFSRLQRFVRRSAVYQYSGSLTTPPCTEGVAWNVLAKPIFIDVKTYWKVKKVLKFNARYTQNAPGGVNLLDNAREVLDGTGK